MDEAFARMLGRFAAECEPAECQALAAAFGRLRDDFDAGLDIGEEEFFSRALVEGLGYTPEEAATVLKQALATSELPTELRQAMD